MKTTADKTTTTASAPETRDTTGNVLRPGMYGYEEALAKRTIPAEKPTDAEICREAGLQAAKSAKWTGWNWKAYQTSITRQNHHISRIQAHADKLAEALREAADWLSRSVRTDDQEQAADAREALAAYEESR